MVVKKQRIVIIGAGMAGLVAANKLYKGMGSKQIFDVCIVEGGDRIGGRINTYEMDGDRIEMGATWIHGIGGSPIHKLAQQIGSLESDQPWERMDGFAEDPITIAEGGLKLEQQIVDPISNIYKKLMDFAQGKLDEGEDDYYSRTAISALKNCRGDGGVASIGGFLRQGLVEYYKVDGAVKELNGFESKTQWSRRSLEEAVFAMYENVERTYTSAGNLFKLDFNAESEYRGFPGEEITIARGYSSVIKSLASAIPPSLIQLGRKVSRIEWQSDGSEIDCGHPVKLHFHDGSIMVADHVIVTVSLGVLKEAIQANSGMFSPPLPSFKTEAISKLGFGVVNKLFVQLDSSNNDEVFPFLQMAFQPSDGKLRNQKIPWWMRRTAHLCPIYTNSSVLLSWFAGEEALELESLEDEEILEGVTKTISTFLPNSQSQKVQNCTNGDVNPMSNGFKFTKVLRSKWGTNPLFKGSYSYVSVGSSGDDLDTMAKPLPSISKDGVPPLQILFAGEATHRTHYSTTHGAYFSGIREANRLLQYYQCGGVSELLHH